MRRWLFNFAAASSLSLFVASVVFWTRSYDAPVLWELTATKGVEDSAWCRGQLCVGQGRVGYVTWTPEPKARLRYFKPYYRFHGMTPASFTYDHSFRYDPWTSGHLSLPAPTNGKDLWWHGVQYSRFTDYFNHITLRQLWLPIWLIAVGFLMLPMLHMALWLRERVRVGRHRRRGRCLSCGYDLTGNTTGVCPECGTPVAEKAGVKA